jgi:hypothetical protein
LDGSIDHTGADNPATDATLRQAESGAGWGILLGALLGGGGTLLVTLFAVGSSATNVAGAAIGGAVIGAALGLVFGSMTAMTNAPAPPRTAALAPPDESLPAVHT